MNSDSRSYITTYSADERIAQDLAATRARKELEAHEDDLERRDMFEEYYAENKDLEDSVFKFPGIQFLKFCHTKIKFTFKPHKVAYVSKTIIFYCTLRYRKNYWVMRRNTFPLNYKWRIYNLFGKSPTDVQIIEVIYNIYGLLLEWSNEHEHFRRQKFMDYKDGCDIFLDSDDEELFLNSTEIEELHRKRDEILSRMRTELYYEYLQKYDEMMIKTRPRYIF